MSDFVKVARKREGEMWKRSGGHGTCVQKGKTYLAFTAGSTLEVLLIDVVAESTNDSEKEKENKEDRGDATTLKVGGQVRSSNTIQGKGED